MAKNKSRERILSWFESCDNKSRTVNPSAAHYREQLLDLLYDIGANLSDKESKAILFAGFERICEYLDVKVQVQVDVKTIVPNWRP